MLLYLHLAKPDMSRRPARSIGYGDEEISLDELAEQEEAAATRGRYHRPEEWDTDEEAYTEAYCGRFSDEVEMTLHAMSEQLGHMKYDASPESEEALLEKVQEYIGVFEEQGVEDADILIGFHASCQTGDPMVMVYERGGLQYHIDTRKIPNFDINTFTELVRDYFGKELRDLDHYVSDI